MSVLVNRYSDGYLVKQEFRDKYVKEFWSHQRSLKKLSDVDIQSITHHMTRVRNEIRNNEEDNIIMAGLIKEGLEILAKHNIQLPLWHNGDTETEKKLNSGWNDADNQTG